MYHVHVVWCACSLTRKAGRTPVDIALREGNQSLAAVLTGVQNRQRNDLHAAFSAGPSLEEQQMRLLDCRHLRL